MHVHVQNHCWVNNYINAFVHVLCFDRSYNWCVIHRAIVNAVETLGYKLTKRMTLPD